MRRLVLGYYAATPLFALLDFAFGLNVRAVFIGSAALRAAYYVLPLACAVAAWRRPALGPLLGMAESGVSLGLLVVGVWLAIMGSAEAVAEGGAASPVLTLRGLVNAALSGGVLAVSFYGQAAAATAVSARGGGRV